MRVALDTNRYVDLCKGVEATVALLEEAEAIMLPFVVVGELRAGFAHGRRQAENERTLRRFLLKEGCGCFSLMTRQPITTRRSFASSGSRAHRFRRTTCGWRHLYCSTTLPCTHETSTSIASHRLSEFERGRSFGSSSRVMRRRQRRELAQSSHFNCRTRPNSRAFDVTSVALRRRACPASKTS